MLCVIKAKNGKTRKVKKKCENEKLVNQESCTEHAGESQVETDAMQSPSIKGQFIEKDQVEITNILDNINKSDSENIVELSEVQSIKTSDPKKNSL